MATKNIVPRADAEGQLGTSTKGWGKIFLGGAAANIDVNNVSGTNTAGKSLTLISGASTGSGAGGSIVFQTAAAGGSGTSVNSHATVLTLDSAKLATFTGGLDIAGAVDIAGDLTLSAGADGALNFSAASSIKILDNSATSLVIEEADTAYMTFVTTNSSEAIKFDKALDINAAVQLDSTLTVGVNDTGYDVKFFGATSGKSLLWDESADSLIVTGTTDLIGTTNLDIVDIDGAVNIGAEVTLAAANKIIFNDASQFIHASSNAILNLGATDEIDLTATAIDVNGTMDVSGAFTNGSTLVSTGKITADAGIDIDNINIDGTTIALSSGNLTLDVEGEIILDSNGTGTIRFNDGGTNFGMVFGDSSNFTLISKVQDKDMIFQGNDGGSTITALTLDMSEAGVATFNDDLIIKTGGTIGGASDPDLLTLSSNELEITGADNVNTRMILTSPGVSNTVLGFNRSGGTVNGVVNNASYLGNLQAYPLVFITNGGVALTLDTSQNATVAGALTVGTGNSSFGGDLFVAGDLTINSQSTASSVTDIDKIIFKKAHTSGAGSGFYNLGEIRSTTNGGFSGGMDFYFNKNAGSGSYTVTKGLSLSDVGDVTINAGNIVIGTAGKGIDFTAENTGRSGGSATDRTASILDDYEEGTWTAVIKDDAGTAVDTVAETGRYTKIGRIVNVSFGFKVSDKGSVNGATGINVHGLPFAVNTNTQGSGEPHSGHCGFVNNLTSKDYGGGIHARFNNNSTVIELKYTPGGAVTTQGNDSLLFNDIHDSNTLVVGAGTYEVLA